MDLSSFEDVSREEFDLALQHSKASPSFRKQYARFAPHVGESYMLHLGHLKMAGHFRAPGFCTLITGDLHVDGIVDLQNPDGYDEGGLFIVLGNVSCHSFFNEYGKCTFVDGNLDARDLLVAAFGDSALVVTRHLSTNFFYGEDIWAEVGAGATMAYGARATVCRSATPRQPPRRSRRTTMRRHHWRSSTSARRTSSLRITSASTSLPVSGC